MMEQLMQPPSDLSVSSGTVGSSHLISLEQEHYLTPVVQGLEQYLM